MGGADLRGRRLERHGVARYQHQVEPGARELFGECAPDALGAPEYQRTRTICSSHTGLVRHCKSSL
jgi:hypothetical protein